MRLSIVVPCFDAEATLPELPRSATHAAKGIVGQDFELVLVCGHEPGTAARVRVRHRNQRLAAK